MFSNVTKSSSTVLIHLKRLHSVKVGSSQAKTTSYPKFCSVIRIQRALFVVIFTGRNEVVAKVIFLHMSVIHSVHRGVCLSACWDAPAPGTRPPLGTRPPGADTNPPPPGSRLQHTVYERPVRILLECIVVWFCFVWLFK